MCCTEVVGGCHWKWTWLFTAATGLDGNEACLPWKFFFKEFADVDDEDDDDEVVDVDEVDDDDGGVEVVLTSMASKGGGLEAIVL